jgi:hypothetical protein
VVQVPGKRVATARVHGREGTTVGLVVQRRVTVNAFDVPVVAGVLATAVFAASTLPMLVKAHRTKDVRSYSLGNIALGNLGSVLCTVYVLDLPPGPIWALHLFHTASTALMHFWYLRYVLLAAGHRRAGGDALVVRDAQSAGRSLR